MAGWWRKSPSCQGGEGGEWRFAAGERLAPVELRNIELARESGVALAEYTVEPSPGDGLVLKIVERYEVAPDGRSLSGTKASLPSASMTSPKGAKACFVSGVI